MHPMSMPMHNHVPNVNTPNVNAYAPYVNANAPNVNVNAPNVNAVTVHASNVNTKCSQCQCIYLMSMQPMSPNVNVCGGLWPDRCQCSQYVNVYMYPMSMQPMRPPRQLSMHPMSMLSMSMQMHLQPQRNQCTQCQCSHPMSM